MPAGTSTRFKVVVSADPSPDDGTGSGLYIAVTVRVRRQSGGTYVVDQTIYLTNMEQNTSTDVTVTGGATLTINFVGVAATSWSIVRADVWEV
jgi:hypothetical protein